MKYYKKIEYLLIPLIVFSLLVNTFAVLIVEASNDINILQDSKIWDGNEWVNVWDDLSCNTGYYNCYAYAINRFGNNKFYDINLCDKYQPGDIYTDVESYANLNNLADIRDSVILDLQAMGYSNISVYYDYSDIFSEDGTSAIDFSTHELICFRMGAEIDNESKLDYHFMRYDPYTNAWYHKPTFTAILKYEGVPSNDRIWTNERVEENGNVESVDVECFGDIWYISYSKLRIVAGNEESNIINIAGGTNKLSGKDTFYEIVVPRSCNYTIQLSTDYTDHDFNYEIYSYNMYNGNYVICASGSGNSTTETVVTVPLTAYNEFDDGTDNWQYRAYRYYIRLDFGRKNTEDVDINVEITHEHLYTDRYEQIQTSTTQHKGYCWCGEYIIEEHITNIEGCSLCGASHSHDYTDYYLPVSGKEHKCYCACGESVRAGHVVVVGSGGLLNNKICILCLGMVEIGASIILSPTQLPRSENGSYITPDGIIVLVEEDVEAYLNGELVFYEQNVDLEVM